SWENEAQHPGAQAPVGSIDGLTFCGPQALRLEEILKAVGLTAGTVQCTTGAKSQQRLDLFLAGEMHTIAGPDTLLPSLS
ncbi:MAG: hypothetical protein RLP45_08145, partial [Haliea sp.]